MSNGNKWNISLRIPLKLIWPLPYYAQGDPHLLAHIPFFLVESA